MNILACAKTLLNYFSKEERSIPDDADFPGRNAEIQSAINGALQELYGRGGKWVRQDERGAVLYEPTSVRITCYTGLTSATIHQDDWQHWMAGCSIVVAGSSTDNQIRNDTREVSLKFPHDGASGDTTAIVYCDSVTVAADVLEVLEPVRVDRRQIVPMPSPYSAIQGHPEGDFLFRRHAIDHPTLVDRLTESSSSPTGFTVQTWSPAATSKSVIRIRVYPSPDKRYFLDYSAMLKPPRIEYIGSLDELPVPYDAVESIFLPLAVKRLAQCPFWRGVVGEPAVNDSYAEATRLISSANPAPSPGIRLVTKF